MKKIFVSLVLIILLLSTVRIVAAGYSGCGSTITEDTTLDADISCSGTALTIGADNITLDCTGHTITYVQTSAGYGIYIAGHTGVTIKNCNIVQGNPSISNASGIYLSSDSSYNTLTGNTISTNGSYAYGIFLSLSSGNTLTGNIIPTNGTSAHGIYLLLSNNNTLTGNIISTYGTSASGIRLSSSSNNTFTSNSIVTSDPDAYGLNLTTSSDNLFYNNYISAVIPVSIVDMSPNFWNASKTVGTNIVGGPYIGGNVWTNPNGTGFSETCTDADNDGICDSAYILTFGNVDYLPLSLVIDSDHDGVEDSKDQCPGTLPGVPVDPNGCSQAQVDQDFDGICDPGKTSTLCSGSDNCPTENATGFDANLDGCIDTLTSLQQIIEALPDGVLSEEIRNSLVSKVNNVLKSIDKEKDGAAINMLKALINQVEAQRGKKIAEETADMLIAYANNLIVRIRMGY